MLAMLATTASAAYDIDIDNDTITISGKTAPNSTVIVAILKPGDVTTEVNVDLIADKPFYTQVNAKVATLLSGDATIEADFLKYKKHFQHVEADDNGAYELSLPVVQNASYDIAFLLVESYANDADGSIIYVPSEATEAEAQAKVSTSDIDKLIKAIEAYDFVFGLDTSSAVYADMKKDIATAIIRMKLENAIVTFDTFSDISNTKSFKSFFNKALAYYTRQTAAVDEINTSTIDSLKAILEKYADDVNVLGTYGRQKLDFAAAYEKYGYMNVNKELVGVIYDDMPSFIDAFNKVVADLKKAANNPGSGTNGNPSRPEGPGGGGGGGGFGGGMSVPTTQGPKVEDEGFNDLDQAPWAEESILNLVDRGVVNGMGDGTFNPNGNVTREQFVKMLLLSFSIEPSATSGSLSDVDGGAWYAPYVNTAYELGIVKGVSDTEFGVGMNITRQDLVTMIIRACEAYGLEISETQYVSFADEGEISDYAYNAVMDLAAAGVINGVTDGVFAPTQNATRAQVSVILDRLYNV